MGPSYGGATAIQWAAREPRVGAVVAVCPFSSLGAVVPQYIQVYAPLAGRLIPSLIIRQAIADAGRMAGFDPGAASPLRAIQTVRTPVLLIHGMADRNIPCEECRKLHAAAPGHSRLILVPDENHFSIMGDSSGVIERESVAWFQRWLRRDPN